MLFLTINIILEYTLVHSVSYLTSQVTNDYGDQWSYWTDVTKYKNRTGFPNVVKAGIMHFNFSPIDKNYLVETNHRWWGRENNVRYDSTPCSRGHNDILTIINNYYLSKK